MILGIVLAGWMFLGAQGVCAMSCYIDAQPEQAEVGQDVTVTVVFSGDNVGRVRATLEYDTSVLSYQGEGGDSGEVSLYMASSGDGIYYSLPFKAVGAGDSSLLMTPLDAYDMDEMSLSLPESQSMTVTVKEKESAEQPAAEPEKTEPEQKEPAAPDVQEEPAQQPAVPEKPQNESPADPSAQRSGSPTVWFLAGLALLAAVLLIVVLIHRNRQNNYD